LTYKNFSRSPKFLYFVPLEVVMTSDVYIPYRDTLVPFVYDTIDDVLSLDLEWLQRDIKCMLSRVSTVYPFIVGFVENERVVIVDAIRSLYVQPNTYEERMDKFYEEVGELPKGITRPSAIYLLTDVCRGDYMIIDQFSPSVAEAQYSVYTLGHMGSDSELVRTNLFSDTLVDMME